MLYRLSPSDLTYLFEGCKYCFSLKVKHKIRQPSMPMPGIFSAIAGSQNKFYAGKRTEDFCQELPPGIVEYGEKWIQSTPIQVNNTNSSSYIAGRFDLVIKFDDGSYGVIDCKTASPSESKTKMYGRQLECYAYSLENPAPGKLALSPINKLGLLYFKPVSFEQINSSQQAFQGDLVFHEVERDNDGFLDFVAEVTTVLDSETIQPHTCDNCEYCSKGNTCLTGKPEAFEKGCTCCTWCTYRLKMRGIDTDSAKPLKNVQQENTPPCPTCNGSMQLKTGRFGEFWSCINYPDCKGTQNV